jgi:peptide deformylase
MNALKKKVALDLLRNPCVLIHTEEEAEVTIRFLESALEGSVSLSAPEVNIFRQASIIRSPNFSLDLINPVITEKSERIISFDELCASFSHESQNCWRYKNITVQTGLDRKEIKLSGKEAILVQHEVDHLSGKVFYDCSIKVALVRNDGIIKGRDFCPCGSKKKFNQCCCLN